MARFRRTFGCLIAASVTLVTIAEGRQAAPAVDRVFRISGSLGPQQARPAGGYENVLFAIYDEEQGGTPLWQEVQTLAVDDQGNYTVLLGATSPAGLPVDLFASGAPRWLAAEVQGASDWNVPRVLLTSVPYSLRAATADNAQTLAGRPASDFQLTRAARGTDAQRGASGEAHSAADREVDPQVNSGTANYIGKFQNNVDLVNSAMFENAGRIGIGTTTPLDSLHARFSNSTGQFTGFAVQNLSNSPQSYSGMLFYDHTGALGQFQGFNNSTKEYRINNIAAGGSINFMLGTSAFRVRPDHDIEIAGNIRDVGGQLWLAVNQYGANTMLGKVALGGGTGAPQGFTHNTAVGHSALSYLQGVSSSLNTAVGSHALEVLTAGSQNTAMGYQALSALQQGIQNIAIGEAAGAFLTSGSQNIYIGSGGAVENGTIRIGDWFNFYNRFFVGGVRGVTTGGSDAVTVVIDGNGQLGTINSSIQYKTDVRDMADASTGVMRLRPVTYRYKKPYSDGSQPVDYGLIAEEVAEVFPDVVTRTADGEVETVQYHKINAMLLNEVQKQHREIDDLRERLVALERLLAGNKK